MTHFSPGLIAGYQNRGGTQIAFHYDFTSESFKHIEHKHKYY